MPTDMQIGLHKRNFTTTSIQIKVQLCPTAQDLSNGPLRPPSCNPHPLTQHAPLTQHHRSLPYHLRRVWRTAALHQLCEHFALIHRVHALKYKCSAGTRTSALQGNVRVAKRQHAEGKGR
jgi:hypothetical protein